MKIFMMATLTAVLIVPTAFARGGVGGHASFGHVSFGHVSGLTATGNIAAGHTIGRALGKIHVTRVKVKNLKATKTVVTARG